MRIDIKREIKIAKYNTPDVCSIITIERAESEIGVISPKPTLVKQVKLKYNNSHQDTIWSGLFTSLI